MNKGYTSFKKSLAVLLASATTVMSLSIGVAADPPSEEKPVNTGTRASEPIGAWTMTEGVGNLCHDTSGGGKPVMVDGTASWQEDDKYGKVLSPGQYARVDAYDLSGSFTLSGWVNIPQELTDYSYILVTENTTDESQSVKIVVSPTTGKIAMENWSENSWNRGYELSEDVRGAGWVHFAFSYDLTSQTIRGYQNGIKCIEEHQEARLGYVPSNKWVFFATAGPKADFRVYDQALTDAQVKALTGDPLPAAIGAWNLNEGLGGICYDSSGNGHDGELSTAGAAWQEDPVMGSVLTPGQFLEVNKGYDLSDSFAVTGWINVPAEHEKPNNWTFVMEANAKGAGNWNIHVNPDGYLVMENLSEAGWNSAYAFSQKAAGAGWIHFAFIYDSATKMLRGYQNGQLSLEAEVAKPLDYTENDTLIIGSRIGGGAPFDGTISRVKIYDRALTLPQLRILSETLPAPEGAWNMTEGDGNLCHDVSGNRQDAGIENAVWQTDERFGSVLAPGQYAHVNSGYDLSGDFTISGWVNIPAAHNDFTFLAMPENTTDDTQKWNIHVNTTGQIVMENTAAWGRGYALPDNVAGAGWVHFAFSYDAEANMLRGFENGFLCFEESPIGPMAFAVDNTLVFGALDGPMANVRIYGTALSKNQIKNLAANAEGLRYVEEDTVDLTPEGMYTRSVRNQGDARLIQNVMQRARRGEKLVIAAIGGSNTEGAGASVLEKSYSYLIYQWWRQKFPDAEFDYVNAGIGSTTSMIGVHRLEEHILQYEPDFVITDFSANDNINDQRFAESYESLLYRLLEEDQRPGIMMIAFTEPHSTAAQELHAPVAQQLGIPFISYGDAIIPMMDAGLLKWEDLTAEDRVHQNDKGYALVADLMIHYLESVYESLPEDPEENIELTDSLPDSLTDNRYTKAEMLNNRAILPSGNQGWEESEFIYWAFQHGWRANKPGSVLEFDLNARLIHLLYTRLVTEDAGTIRVTVDDNPPVEISSKIDGGGSFPDCAELYMGDVAENHHIRIELLEGRFDILALFATDVGTRPQAPEEPETSMEAPVGAWNLNEGTGSDLPDYAGDHSGKPSGSLSWLEDGKFGYVISQGTYLTVKNSYDMSGDFTISGWVNVDAGHTGYKFILQSKTDIPNNSWNIHVNPKGELVIEASAWGRGYAMEKGSLNGVGWTHFTFVYDSEVQSLYGFINGQQVMGPQAVAGPIGYSDKDQMIIGARADGNDCLDGHLSKIRIFDRMVSGKTISLMAADEDGIGPDGSDEPDQPIQPKEPKPIAGWNLTEGKGNALAGVVAGGQATAVSSKLAEWKPDDRFGSVYNFAAGQYLTVENGVSLGNAFTVTGWLKAPKGNGEAYRAVMTRGVKDRPGYWEIVVNPDGKLAIWSPEWSRGCDTDQKRVDDNQWHRFAFVYDGTVMNVYLDGVCVAQNVEMDCPVSTASAVMRIGAYVDGELQLDGALARLRIYNEALDAEMLAKEDTLTEQPDSLVLPELPKPLGEWLLTNGYADTMGRKTTPSQSAAYVQDPLFGKLFSFQNGQTLTVNSSYLLDGDFTLTGFLRVPASNGSGYRAIMTNGEKNNPDYWEVVVNPEGKLSFYSPIFDRGVDSDRVRVDDNQWHSYSIVYRDGIMNLFVDGRCAAKNVAVTRTGNVNKAVSKTLMIGGYAQGEMLLDGQLANLRIYKTALTDEKLAVLSSNVTDNRNPDAENPGTGATLANGWAILLAASSLTLCLSRKKRKR